MPVDRQWRPRSARRDHAIVAVARHFRGEDRIVAEDRRPGLLIKRRPHRYLRNGKSEISQVPVKPTRRPCPALRPRGETHVRRCGVNLAAFHFENSVGLRVIFVSRLNHTA
jgi:hypothetical protein